MKLEVNTDALGRDINRLQSLIAGLRKDLDALSAEMYSLNETWDGIAKEAYLVQYQIDEVQMNELCQFLELFIQALSSAQEQYQFCDINVKSVISEIKV